LELLLANQGQRPMGKPATMADSIDPIHQFKISNLFPIARIGPVEIALSNSALFMVLSVALIVLFLLAATRTRALVPSRLQSSAELFYEFVANTVLNTVGSEGMMFFPLVFSLFMFILFANTMGMIPVYGFTVTSHLIITVALALLVFLTVIIVGFWRNGLPFRAEWRTPLYVAVSRSN
jgi:F-type H+-transporting ATPase subunit a